jgi:hypothetical protein
LLQPVQNRLIEAAEIRGLIERGVVSDNGSDCEGNDGAYIGPRDHVVAYASDAENDADAAADDEEIEEVVPFLCTPYEVPPMEIKFAVGIRQDILSGVSIQSLKLIGVNLLILEILQLDCIQAGDMCSCSVDK